MCLGISNDSVIPIGELLFKLAFGTEAIIPLKIGLPMLWMKKIDTDDNFFGFRVNLDLSKETQERT